jgi:hypothetical protein
LAIFDLRNLNSLRRFISVAAAGDSPWTGNHFGRNYPDAPRNKTPQARAGYCWLPSAPARYTLCQAAEDAALEELNLRVRSMAEISMLVTSIDPLAAYKVSDDLILELMSVTASVEDDSEGASVGTWWVQIVEPHELVKHQPHGGYMLDNAKSK